MSSLVKPTVKKLIREETVSTPPTGELPDNAIGYVLNSTVSESNTVSESVTFTSTVVSTDNFLMELL